MMRNPISLPAVVLLLAMFANSADSHAGALDPDTVWPLCGRITDNPPPGWTAADGCPAERFGNATFSDEPLSATFGPRPLASENNRYDFHRGVDIATPEGTPFFAIADGVVRIAGNHSSYSDPLVSLRHFRPGESSCSAQGCYHSYYLHISSWVVSPDETVSKGQLLGYTGSSGSGFAHLHFEVRDAPASDPFSAWSRDAIHPLGVLPYAAANNTSVVFNAVDLSNPQAGRTSLTVTSNRFDLVQVDLTLLDDNQQVVPQSGNQPNLNGYHVLPAFFDMELANFQYSHKDSSAFPWESYGAGGANECPSHQDHGPSYSAHVHLDAQHPDDFHDGLFNGLHVTTQKYWPSNVDDYRVGLEFLALEGPAACIQATALFASGASSTQQWGSCEPQPNQPPSAAFIYSCTDLQCSFDGSSSADADGSIVSHAWDFGDGGTASQAQAEHAYASAGDWLVTLTVTDDDDASDAHSQWVSVTEAPAPVIELSVSTNKKRNRVSLQWSGASGNKVDIFRDGVKITATRNDGNWNDRNVTKGTPYQYQVCEQGSGANCSDTVTINL